MTHFADLRSSRLIIRPPRLSDAAALAAYRGLPEVARFQSWTSFDEADARNLVAGQESLEPDRPGTWFQVVLVEAASGALVGDCGLHVLNDDARQVELGVTLHPDHQHRGIAAEALSRLLDHLFGTLEKHRVTAVTDADNQAAARLFDRLGFRKEAHFIENILFKGRYGSEFLFALLRAEWAARGSEATPGEMA